VKTSKLHNYIRTHRKRAGLTQDEVAYLLGYKSGSKVSRCEHFKRECDLETALAFEVIFATPVRELFAGLYQQVEKKTIRRIGLLARKLMNGERCKWSDYKLDSLAKAVRKSTPEWRQEDE
jgi:hypothetical protein